VVVNELESVDTLDDGGIKITYAAGFRITLTELREILDSGGDFASYLQPDVATPTIDNIDDFKAHIEYKGVGP
jgi:hypothetical protein